MPARALHRIPALRLAVAAAFLSLSLLAPAALALPQDGGTSRDSDPQTRQVNVYTRSHQTQVTVASAPDGSSVAAWSSRRQEAGTDGVFARALDAWGHPVGDEVRVNATVAGAQTQPAVGRASDGSTWIAWISDLGPGHVSVLARRFSRQLEPLTGEIALDPESPWAGAPTLTVDASGRAFVAWLGNAGGPQQLRGRWLEASGRLAEEVLSLSDPDLHADPPAVAALSDGRQVVVWPQAGLG
ncbi:MAG: hypothetical protein KDD47_21585, partial [Acidobacteria bacterium]|nr:hypothetical protein [Acidobacteriota bacterium]